jgi:hypothetical protein
LKKGVINLAIEIDYDEMITEETISALQGYTGKEKFDEIADDHMLKIGEQLMEVVKDKPFVKYKLGGNLVPLEEMESQEAQEVVDTQESIVDTPAEEEEEELDEMPSKDLPITIGEAKRIIKLLDDDINSVSMEKGMPKLIKVNGTVYHAIESIAEDKLKTGNGVPTYNGFPIQLEGMSEWYEIKYKSYKDNSVDHFARLGDE